MDKMDNALERLRIIAARGHGEENQEGKKKPALDLTNVVEDQTTQSAETHTQEIQMSSPETNEETPDAVVAETATEAVTEGAFETPTESEVTQVESKNASEAETEDLPKEVTTQASAAMQTETVASQPTTVRPTTVAPISNPVTAPAPATVSAPVKNEIKPAEGESLEDARKSLQAMKNKEEVSPLTNKVTLLEFIEGKTIPNVSMSLQGVDDYETMNLAIQADKIRLVRGNAGPELRLSNTSIDKICEKYKVRYQEIEDAKKDLNEEIVKAEEKLIELKENKLMISSKAGSVIEIIKRLESLKE